MLYVGVDLGGTNMAAGVVTRDGRILCQDSAPTQVGLPYEVILKNMAGLIENALAQSGHTIDEIGAIGIGSPGAMDDGKGMVVFANNLYWHHVPVRAELQRYFDKPVYVENDANVAGLAEMVAGAGRGYKDLVLLTLGTGVGSGIILGGRVFGGSHHVGAELGHLCVQMDGEQCTCGNKGCLERYASATALVRDGRRAMVDYPDSIIATKAGGNLTTSPPGSSSTRPGNRIPWPLTYSSGISGIWPWASSPSSTRSIPRSWC
jgi:glucokinase